MTGRQRYLSTLRGQPTDYLPRIPILMQYAAEFIGSDYARFAADYSVLVEANIRCAEYFDIDQLSCISDAYRETEAFGGQITYRTDSPPSCTAPLAERKDLSLLKSPEPHTSIRMKDRIEAVRAYKNRTGSEYSLLGWIEGPAAEASTLRGPTSFLTDFLLDEPFASDLLDVCVEVGIAFAEAQLAAGCDTIGIGDAITSQLSPDLYLRFIQPRQKRLVQAIREAGGFVKLHICGDISHLLDGIADLELDICDVDHMVDMETVRTKLGQRVTLSGNLDPVEAIKNGNPESIRSQIKRVYGCVGDPYMVNAGCEIPAGTAEENLISLCRPVTTA